MISEQDKKEIFNGTLARTRNTKKAKFILKSEHEANFNYPYLFLISDKDKCYTDWYDEHLTSKQDKYNSAIVRLWEDEQKPFDLERALAGEPVKLRNGKKAYVKYDLPSEYKGKYPLNGYYIDPTNPKELVIEQWARDGRAFIFQDKHDLDIIGMWKAP